MYIRVLGPLTVEHDGAHLPTQGPKLRALLAALLIDANRSVTRERLIDLLWPEDVPPTAMSALHNLILRLRRALGAHGGRIRTTPSGYQLDVASDEVDLLEFTAGCRRGLDAFRNGDWAEASAVLGAALGLWRGEPLADLPASSPLRAATTAWTSQYLHALETRLDADLKLGRHQELLPELIRLVAAHPLRERFHALLMRASHLAGRQADALAAYRDARDVLVAELGVEPGPELQRLHREILSGDHRPAAPDPPEHHGAVRPAQLPADLADFTAREQQVKHLTDLLTAEPRDNPRAPVIAAVTGTGGIGKTALAVHVAHRVVEHFPDGQLYVDLRGADHTALSPGDVLSDFLHDLAPAVDAVPADEARRAARYRSLLAGRRVLVVLDNAKDTAQVRPLLPGSGGCAVLITSRGRLAGLAGASMVGLDVLDDDAARGLFTAIVGGERARAEPDAVARVLACCAGLPLAVRVVAARLATRPEWDVATLAARLADETSRLDELRAEDVAVRASIEVSYRDLADARLARVFRLFGLFVGAEIGLPAASALVGLPVEATESALERLVDVNLVQPTVPGRYRLHDLLRVFAAERAVAEEPEDERRAAVARLTRWCLSAVAGIDRIVAPHRRRPEFTPRDGDPTPPVFDAAEPALAWCEAERETILAVTRMAAASELHELAWLLPVVAQSYYSLRARWSDWLTANEIGLSSARLIGDRVAEAYLLTSRGEVLGRTHQLAEAQRCLAASLAIRRELGDLPGELSALIGLGVLAEQQGDYAQAVEHTSGALELARSMGDRSAESYALANIGVYQDHLGNRAEAIARHRQSLVIFRELANVSGEGLALLNIAEAYLHDGRFEPALRRLRQALPVIRAGGDQYDEAMAVTHIGRILAELGQPAEARTHLALALDLWSGIDEGEADRTRELLATLDHVT